MAQRIICHAAQELPHWKTNASVVQPDRLHSRTRTIVSGMFAAVGIYGELQPFEILDPDVVGSLATRRRTCTPVVPQARIWAGNVDAPGNPQGSQRNFDGGPVSPCYDGRAP